MVSIAQWLEQPTGNRKTGVQPPVDAQPFFRITFSMTSRRGSALTAAAFPSWVRGSGGPVDRLRKREVIFLSLKTSIYKFHFVCSLVGFFQKNIFHIHTILKKPLESVTDPKSDYNKRHEELGRIFKYIQNQHTSLISST